MTIPPGKQTSKEAVKPPPKKVEKKIIKKIKSKPIPQAPQVKLTLDPRTGILSKVGPNKKVFSTRCSKSHCEGVTPLGGSLSYDYQKGKFSNFVFKEDGGKTHNVKVVYDRLGYHFILNGKRFGALGWNSKTALFEVDWRVICWGCIGKPNYQGTYVNPDEYRRYDYAICGNGRVESGEQCDYANRTATLPAGFSCDTRCHLIQTCQTSNDPHCWLLCGNGVVDPGEECEFSSETAWTCDSSCHLISPTCFGCGTRGICSGIPGSFTSCDTFFSEPTCGASCPLGVVVPSTDASTALCTLPVEERPADSQVREYTDYTLISQCQTGTSVRYTFCGEDGDVTSSIGECPAGQICRDGGCTEAGPALGESFCADTDPENDVHDEGTIVGISSAGEGFIETDYCDSYTYVMEFWCMGDGLVGMDMTPCPAEEHCELGSCFPNRSCLPTCADSDSSNDIYVSGNVIALSETCESSSRSDFCLSNSNVRQYSCNSDSTVSHTDTICPGGMVCLGGACIPSCTQSCTDSDPSDDVHIRSLVTATTVSCTNFSLFDECSGSTHVYEYFCDSGQIGISFTPCLAGEECENGACRGCTRPTCALTPATATDPGYVTGINCAIQHDICDASTVVTYICGADGLPTEGPRILCPNGCRVGADGLAI